MVKFDRNGNRGFRKPSEIIKYFCSTADINGWKYIVGKRESVFTRAVWMCCHLILIILTGFLVTNLWYSFMENPTLTYLQSSSYPVQEVSFPAISLCNVNKISKRKAVDFAHYLSNLTMEDPALLLKDIELLGLMYSFGTAETENLDRFQAVLDKLQLHPRTVLRGLTTTCEELLLKCLWGGHVINCSKHFRFTLTFEGYCCLFNYLKEESNLGDLEKTVALDDEVKHQKGGGSENGLTVFIRNEPEDYFFALLPSVGVKVHIFMPTDFPGMNSGSLTDMLVGHGTETFLGLTPSIFDTDDSVIRYSLDKRKCFFSEERDTVFGKYSESDCIVDCIITKMLAFCSCVPFMMPVHNNLVCTMSDIPCINKHADKWNTLAPSDLFDDELFGKELENGLHCKYRCYPSCTSTLYKVFTSSPKLHVIDMNSDIRNTDTIVHVYFREPFASFYRQDEVYVWFEILSNFGGIFSLAIGLSLISIVELLIFGLKYVYSLFKCQ